MYEFLRKIIIWQYHKIRREAGLRPGDIRPKVELRVGRLMADFFQQAGEIVTVKRKTKTKQE